MSRDSKKVVWVLLLSFSIPVCYLIAMTYQLSRYKSGFAKIQKGMTIQQIKDIMGSPSLVKGVTITSTTEDGDEKKETLESSTVTYQYIVEAIDQDYTFEIEFDGAQKVVSKRLYD